MTNGNSKPDRGGVCSRREVLGGALAAMASVAIDITSGLQTHLTFDVDASDSSGNNYDGVLTNGAAIDGTNVTDQIGDAKLSLDGTDDRVSLHRGTRGNRVDDPGDHQFFWRQRDAEAEESPEVSPSHGRVRCPR